MANEIDFKKLEKEIENTTKQTKNFNKELNSTTKILSSSKDNFFTYLASGMKEAESSISVVDTLAGKLNDTVSGTATAIGSIGSLFSNASKESTISITDITSTISSGFGGAISAISGTIDLAIMLGSAFNQMYQAALDKKIDEHFGSVNLSLQQIESLADDITSNSWTMKIDTVITAQEQLNTLRSSIQTNIDTLNQLNWKVSVGMELTEDDKENYKQSINSYIADTNQFLSQQWYTTSVAIDVLFGSNTPEGVNAQEMADSYYNGLNTELSNLGTQLSDLVNKAFEDNMLSEDEIKLIHDKQQQIQNEIDSVEATRYKVEIDQIAADAVEGGLTKESFAGLQDQINAKMDERKQEIQNTKIEALIPWQAKLDRGEISQEEFDQAKKDIEFQSNAQMGNVVVDTVSVEVGTIKSNWSDELDKKLPDFQTQTKEWMEKNKNNMTEAFSLVNLGNGEGDYLSANLSAEAEQSIKDMLKKMSPRKEQLEELAQQYKDLGKAVPQNVVDGLSEIYELEAAVGEQSGIYGMLAQQIANDPEYFKLIEQAQKQGKQIPDALLDAIETYTGMYYSDKDQKWISYAMPTDEEIENVKTKLQEQGIELSDAVIESLATVTPSVQQKAIELANAYTLSDNEEEKQNLLLQLAQLGVTMDDALAQGIYQNMGFVQLAGSDTITAFNTATGEEIGAVTPEFVQSLSNMGLTGLFGMQQVLNGNPLNAPSINDIDASQWATHNIMTIQNAINGKTITVKMVAGELMYPSGWMTKDGKRIPISWTYGTPTYVQHANGGFVDKEQLSWIAEGDKPEVVIPLDPGKRTRAMQLFAQTSELLGVSVQARNGFPLGDSLSPSTSVVDYSRLAALITDSLKSSAIQCNPVFQVSQGDVYLDSEKAGRALTPVISRIQAKTAKFETR